MGKKRSYAPVSPYECRQFLINAFETMLGHKSSFPPPLDLQMYWSRQRWEYGSTEYSYRYEVKRGN